MQTLAKYIEAYNIQLTVMLSAFTLVVAFIGTAFTLYYARQTLSYAFEKDMKPLLLREGFLNGFDSFPIVDPSKPIHLNSPLMMSVVQNVATRISGTVTINGFRYKLLVSTLIRIISYDKDGKLITDPLLKDGKMTLSPPAHEWAWLPQGERLAIMADESTKKDSKDDNGIEISFSSVTGRAFVFREDKNYVQTVNLK